MPIGAFGGRRDVMSALAPAGVVYQAGTLSGNPVAVNVGLKTLEIVSKPGFYEALSEKSKRLCAGLSRVAEANGVPLRCDHRGGMFGLLFANTPARTFSQVKTADKKRFARFHRAMLERGVYLAPSAFEAGFVSSAHTDDDIDTTVDAADRVFKTGQA